MNLKLIELKQIMDDVLNFGQTMKLNQNQQMDDISIDDNGKMDCKLDGIRTKYEWKSTSILENGLLTCI